MGLIQPPQGDWPAINAARQHRAEARLPFLIQQVGRAQLAGSVAHARLPALARWPQALRQTPERLLLRLPADERDDFFCRGQALAACGRAADRLARRALRAACAAGAGRPATIDAPLLARLGGCGWGRRGWILEPRLKRAVPGGQRKTVTSVAGQAGLAARCAAKTASIGHRSRRQSVCLSGLSPAQRATACRGFACPPKGIA